MNIRFRSPAWLLLALFCPWPLSAQEPAAVRKIVLPNLDAQVRARLVALEAKLNPVHSPHLAAALVAQIPGSALFAVTPILTDERNREVWEQMPEDYYRLTLESGDALITPHDATGASSWSSVQVRRLCHQRLAALPRSSLDWYRRRVDAEAKALLEQGRRSRSPAPLRRLVDDLFCSSPGDEALDLLGDLAFERGDFGEARHWWSLLSHYPGPKVDLIRIEAKQTLAMIFAGRLDEARVEIKRFGDRHPQAKGALAGRDGVYADTLQKSLNSFVQARHVNNDAPWTTFGGDATRNCPLTLGLPHQLWEDGPAWSIKLPALTMDGKVRDGVPDRTALTRRAAFHPVIVNNQVLIADHRTVVSHDLHSGKELFRFDLKSARLHDPGAGIDRAIRLPRFTLSVDHERAYVRLGRLGIAPKRDADKAEPSYLVCLDLTQPERPQQRLLWHVEASADDKAVAVFEGSPLVHDGRVYIAVSHVFDQRVVTSIVCYDALGRQRWSREVCDCPEFEDHANGPRYRQHLLTWAGGQIAYCSNTGAIVAVDAWTGQPTWGVRYPSRGPALPDSQPSPRDLVPCVYADGCVYAAPLDTDRLFCIDSVSGEVRWELEGIEITHLLGVTREHVYVTTRTGVQAIGVHTGRAVWRQPTEGRLPSLGRGLLAGSWLYWPTTDDLLPYRAVALRDGQQEDIYDPTRLRRLPVGNAAFGQGCLAIAGMDELVVFTPPERQPMPDPRPQARIEALYQQARRAADPERAYLELLEATKTHPRAFEWRMLIEGRLLASGGRKPPDAIPSPRSSEKSSGGLRPPLAENLISRLAFVRAWEVDGAGTLHAGDNADAFFFCTQPGHVTCRSVDDGAARWQRKLDLSPTRLDRWRDLVIVMGVDAVSALSVHDGCQAWSLAAPSRRWKVGSVENGVPRLGEEAAGFVHAELWDDTLVLLDDHRRFMRVRLDTGETIWRHESPAAAARPLDAASFQPHVLRVGDELLTQTGTGRLVWIGKKAVGAGTTSRAWQQVPLVVGDRIVVASEEGRVLGYDKLTPHVLRWTYQAPFTSSLTGELTRLFTNDSVLLALVSRNDGHEWVRLDPAHGRPLWSVPANQLPDGLDLGSVALGDTQYYYVRDDRLIVRSLNDGSLQWQQPLTRTTTRLGSPGRWQVRYTKDYLAVYPLSALSQEPFFVGFIDPWKGGWLQRLSFPDHAGAGQAVVTPSRVLVSAGAKIFGFRRLADE